MAMFAISIPNLFSLFSIATSVVAASINSSSPQISHEVHELPNQIDGSIPFRHYAGFQSLETNEEMFYWFNNETLKRSI
jgi:hypothetical protein